jgi:hypothetical protein
MDHLQLSQQFRTLGAVRAFVLQKYIETAASEEDNLDEQLTGFFEHVDGVVLIGKSIGLDLDGALIMPRQLRKTEDLANIMPLLIDNIFLEDKLFKKIQETFGDTYAFQFLLAQMLFMVRILRNFYAFDLRMTPSHRRPIIKEQVSLAHEYLDAVSEFLLSHYDTTTFLFDEQFSQDCRELANYLKESSHSLQRFRELDARTAQIVDSLVPHYFFIGQSLEYARKTILELHNCPPGRATWRTYEDICIRALRLLFVPPFRKVMIQSRTANGHQRRDAVLPNNQFEGFWRLIRDEFNSRHIICEFKNSSRPVSKNDLNQLRIYLSRPTIGRFGLLFARNRVDEGLIQARREAYAESGILVLLITDQVLTTLLRARAFNGSAEFVLEEMKAHFELTY